MQNVVHHSEPGFSELCVYGVLGTASLWVIAVGLLWHRQSLFRVKTRDVHIWQLVSALLSSGLLMFRLVVGSQMLEAYSSVDLTKV